MNDAIYYPSMQCKDRSLLASALFLWDSLSFIVPHEGMMGHSGHQDIDEALEIIGRELVPSSHAKEEAANEIRQLFDDTSEKGIDLQLTTLDPNKTYPIYPGKFQIQLWNDLSKQRATIFNAEHNQYDVLDTLGLYMMSTLAAACGAGRKRLVTDEIAGYESLYRSIADSTHDDLSPEAAAPLLTVALNGFNFDAIPFDRLIELRRDESDLQRSMRTAYLDSVDRCVEEISTHATRPDIVDEIVKQFTNDMERDLRELKRYLKREAGSMLLSKEFGVAVLGTAWSSVEPITGAVLSTGALTRGLVKYQDKRRDLLKTHASAWLYETRQGIKLY
tara:strand:+ start:31253 stop:32251 length:999 start_codon:yes stop_codon:yes gene_type:complete